MLMSLKQRKIKFKIRINLNHNIYLKRRVSKINPLTLSSLLLLLKRYKCLLFLPNKHFLRYTYNKTKHMNTGDHLKTPILSRCSKGRRKPRARDVTIMRSSRSRARKFLISPSLRHRRSHIHFYITLVTVLRYGKTGHKNVQLILQHCSKTR